MKVVLAGDTHGQTAAIDDLFEVAGEHEADGVFVLGDFGIWDHADGGAFTNYVSDAAWDHGLTVWFLPGNHENYELLDRWEKNNPRDKDGFVQVKESLLYSPRGHRWTWKGVDFLSMGGAYSVDKEGRVLNDFVARTNARRRAESSSVPWKQDEYRLAHEEWSWWAREEITQAEADVAAHGRRVDVMLAHDFPFGTEVGWNRKNIPACEPNQKKLRQIVDAVQPKLYAHGHLHHAYHVHLGDTFVRGFDCDEGSSASSGGSGELAASWGLLTLHEPGGLWGYDLQWADADGRPHNSFFTTREG